MFENLFNSSVQMVSQVDFGSILVSMFLNDSMFNGFEFENLKSKNHCQLLYNLLTFLPVHETKDSGQFSIYKFLTFTKTFPILTALPTQNHSISIDGILILPISISYRCFWCKCKPIHPASGYLKLLSISNFFSKGQRPEKHRINIGLGHQNGNAQRMQPIYVKNPTKLTATSQEELKPQLNILFL